MTKLDWGSARREVLALMPEIDIYLADGHTVQSIFDMFKRDDKIDCQYRTFARWVVKLSDRHPHTVKHPTLPVSKQKPEPKIIPKQTKKISSAEKTSAEPSSVRVAKTIMPKLDN